MTQTCSGICFGVTIQAVHCSEEIRFISISRLDRVVDSASDEAGLLTVEVLQLLANLSRHDDSLLWNKGKTVGWKQKLY